MIITGKVVEVEWDVDIPKKDGGSYTGTTLVYKDAQGKVQNKAWVKKALDHTANAHVKAALHSLYPGVFFEAEAVKNDAGFWNWTTIKITEDMGTKKEITTTPRSTYETPEERAERRALDKEKFSFEKEKQKLIIRQSSLSNAIAFMGNSDTVTTDNIIEVAKEFEAYVLST